MGEKMTARPGVWIGWPGGLWIALLASLLVGCAAIRGWAAESSNIEREVMKGKEAVSPTPQVTLPDFGPAPELANKVWLNIDEPLQLAALRGKVVLLEMWTFG